MSRPNGPTTMRTSSVHRRVLVAALLLIAVALGVVGTTVTLTLRHQLRTALRSHLSSTAVLATQLAGTLPAQALADRLSTDQITARVTTGSATVVGTPTPAPKPPSAPAPAPAATPAPTAIRAVPGGGLRLTEALPGGQTVTLSASESPITATVRHLVAIEVAVSLAALLIAAAALRFVTRLALAPLARVAAVAAAIAGGEAGRRLRPSRADTELGAMAAAFDAMVDSQEAAIADAQGSESRMRQFLADASHELRTPVASVHATLETLLRDDPPRPVREELEVIALRELARLSRLVADLLALARTDTHLVAAAQEVDIAAVARHEVERLRHRAPDTEVALDAPAELRVRTDPDAVARALSNVLDNAVAAAPGGTVAVRAERVGAVASIVVDDTGPGVPAEDRQRVFERFVRLDPSRRAGGAGLGLAIARAGVRRQGGDVTCSGRPGGEAGARFTIVLPDLVEVASPTGVVAGTPAPVDERSSPPSR